MPERRRFFIVDDTGICIEEISSWWIAECAPNGPALVINTVNGKLVHLSKEGQSPREIMLKLVEFIEQST